MKFTKMQAAGNDFILEMVWKNRKIIGMNLQKKCVIDTLE